MTAKSKTHPGVTALFPGSFNPFTMGHKSLVDRALSFCDKVIILIGFNVEKGIENKAEILRRMEEIRALYSAEPRVSVDIFSGLTGTYAVQAGVDFILRGVRNVSDFEYERNMADANRNLFGVETVILPSLPELSWISSSAVRELKHFGADVSGLTPIDPCNH